MSEPACSELARAMLRGHPGAAALVLEAQDPADVAAFLAAVEPADVVPVLAELPASYVGRFLALLPPERMLALTREYPLGHLTAVLRCLDAERQEAVLADLPARKRVLVRPMRFAEHTVGAWVDVDSVIVPPQATIREALRRNRRASGAEAGLFAVVDHNGRYEGAVDPAALIRIPINTPVLRVLEPNLRPLPASLPLAQARENDAWLRYRAMPVIDGRDQYLGMLGYRALRQALAARGEELDLGRDDAFASLWSVYSAGLGALTGMFMRIVDSGGSPLDDEPQRGADDGR